MDDEQPNDGGFYNPYDSGFYDSGPTFDKGSPSLNPTVQNKSNSNVQVNPLPTDDQSNQRNPDHIHHHHHHQRPHTHTHRHHTHVHDHHTHVHDHDHHKHHHHHEHPPPEQEPPPHIHEQPPHVHEHHHHIHDQQVHVHDHPTHVHEHKHHHHDHHQHQHHLHEHQHNSNSPSALTIRRHIPGSTDPSLHQYPPTLSLSPDYMYPPLQPPPPLYVPSPLYNVPSPLYNLPQPSNVQVTIRRNTPQADHTLIQPIFYPVAVFTNSPAPQPTKEVVKLPPTKPATPKLRTPIPILPARTSPIPPATPAKSSPIPSRFPVRLPPSPSKSPVRLPPSPSPLPPPPPRRISPQPSPPPPRRQSILVRKPVRTDLITSSVHRTIKQGPASQSRSSRVVDQQTINSNQYNRRQTAYSGPKRRVSYRTVPGLTTRELENEEMDDSGAPIYVQTPRVQTVTYRT